VETLYAGDYSAVVNTYGELVVRTKAPRHIVKMSVSGEDYKSELIPYSDISRSFAASPVLIATYAGDRYLNIDMDCGAQRWNGGKSMIWLRKALYVAGFSKKEVDKLFREMKKYGATNSVRRSG
jgi:hypothetical protein